MKTIAENFIYPYLSPPSLHVVACGVGFGTARICAGHLLSKLPFFAAAGVVETQTFGLLAVAYLIVRCIAIPFFEEAAFRKNLNNPSCKQILENAIYFGLIHGLMPGPIETRTGRIISSAIGGLFYCGARVVGGNLWSSAIAHSMYNLRPLLRIL